MRNERDANNALKQSVCRPGAYCPLHECQHGYQPQPETIELRPHPDKEWSDLTRFLGVAAIALVVIVVLGAVW